MQEELERKREKRRTEMKEELERQRREERRTEMMQLFYQQSSERKERDLKEKEEQKMHELTRKMNTFSLCGYGLEEVSFDQLKYTQDSVACTFRDGGSVRNASEKHLEDHIEVTRYNGSIYILSNRTAVAKQLAGHESVMCKFKDIAYCKEEFLKKKTGNGSMPRIRGKKLF